MIVKATLNRSDQFSEFDGILKAKELHSTPDIGPKQDKLTVLLGAN